MTNKATFSTLRTLAAGGIGATYAEIGSTFERPARAIRMTNNTDGDLFLSDDGVNNKWYLPSTSYVLYDVSSNGWSNSNYRLPEGTQIWVKEDSTPTTGSVHIEVLLD